MADEDLSTEKSDSGRKGPVHPPMEALLAALNSIHGPEENATTSNAALLVASNAANLSDSRARSAFAPLAGQPASSQPNPGQPAEVTFPAHVIFPMLLSWSSFTLA